MSGHPSSTGLDPNVAAALAYLAGPFSGLLLLLVEKHNAYVRFHAMQSILALGGLWLLAAGLGVLAVLTVFVSPTGFALLSDNTFEYRGVFGRSILSVRPRNANWYVKSITYRGQDLADSAFDYGDTDSTGCSSGSTALMIRFDSSGSSRIPTTSAAAPHEPRAN